MQKIIAYHVGGVLLIGLMFGLYQYFQALHVENVSAVTVGTSNPGHNWSSMECSSDTICIDTVNKRVGIGTNIPSKTLEVNGDIKVAGDVCTAGGVCLSALGVAVSGTALINGVHSYKNCTDAGGTVVGTGQIGDQCRFNAAACPLAWTRFRLWSTTTPKTVSGTLYHTGVAAACGTNTCTVSDPFIATTTTGSHAWADLATETSVSETAYAGYGAGDAGCCCWGSYYCVTTNFAATANITQIGCY